jgi:hypothetical protein
LSANPARTRRPFASLNAPSFLPLAFFIRKAAGIETDVALCSVILALN